MSRRLQKVEQIWNTNPHNLSTAWIGKGFEKRMMNKGQWTWDVWSMHQHVFMSGWTLKGARSKPRRYPTAVCLSIRLLLVFLKWLFGQQRLTRRLTASTVSGDHDECCIPKDVDNTAQYTWCSHKHALGLYIRFAKMMASSSFSWNIYPKNTNKQTNWMTHCFYFPGVSHLVGSWRDAGCAVVRHVQLENCSIHAQQYQ